MAYGVKWFSEFSDNGDTRIEDIDPVIYRVEILERDYSGSSTEVLSGESPFILEDTTGGDINRIIREQKATIEWICEDDVDFSINELFITDDKKYQVRFYEYDGGSLKIRWYGFLVPIDCEEPFHSKPYPVTMAATCGLPFLSDDYFLDSIGRFVEGKKSLIDLVAHCLTSTGLELDIHANVNLYEEGMSTSLSPLQQAEIDADGLRGQKAYQVLEGILSPFWAFITQENGVWAIRGRKEQTAVNNLVRKFSPAGNYLGEETVRQSVGIGRLSYNGIPSLRPTADVVERLAEPNSIVTETVSPGIPVNRLFNGTFSGVVSGGNIPGWNNHMDGFSWARQGSNRPDDPYRLEFYGQVLLQKEKSNYRFKPFNYFDTGPIVIRPGDFFVDSNLRKETKIVIAGALRMWNTLGFAIYVTINEQEREFASFLDTNGEWFYSKKEERSVDVKSNQNAVYTPGTKGYNDLDTQTFEVTSKAITNFIKEGNQAASYIRVRIFPGIQGPGYLGEPAFLSVEDLSLIVVEDSVFEGEHQYQVDGGLAIRDANEVQFTTIIADKVDILTPEQSRPANRVMTGYMTRAGGNALTTGWKYPDEGIYEPIQKRALRNRIRQLCGKRRVIDGVFYGYDLRPGMSAFNLYDAAFPAEFFAVTGWKWDVKNVQFDATFHELDFTPLALEDIYLYDDEAGRRGNRMYRNASGSSAGGLTPKPIEEIVLDDLPVLYYEIGKLTTQTVPLAKYIVSNHEPYQLEATVVEYPEWVSNVTIDRGMVDAILDIKITGKPTAPGLQTVVIELVGVNAEDYQAVIYVRAIPTTKVGFTLLDGSTVVGKLPGAYPMPDTWDGLAAITGEHDWYQIDTYGGGADGNAVRESKSEDVLLTDKGTYNFFDAPITSPFGSYRTFVTTSIEKNINSRTNVAYVLGDEAFLALVEFYLTSGGSNISEIAPNGSNVFADPGAANVKAVIADTEHDKAFIQLTKRDETPVDSREFVITGEPVEDAEYSVFGSDTVLAVGDYTATITLYLENQTVSVRFVDFSITKAKPAKQGDSLKLVQQVSGGLNFTELAVLPQTGGSYDLPANYSVLSDAESEEFDWEGFTFHQLRGGKLIEIDVERYTGTPQFKEYSYSVTQSEYYIFDSLNSLAIDAIHFEGASQRVVVTRKLGGASGTVSAIFQAEFTFGPPVDLDDIPEDEPGSGMTDYVAGEGLSEIVEDYIKRFNVNVDGETIEIFQPESPDDPTLPGLNHLRVKESGILFEHIQDLPSMTVIGNLTNVTGVSYAVDVKDIFEDAELGDLVTAIAIKNYITQQLEGSISGTLNYLPKYTSAHELGLSQLFDNGTNVGVGLNTPTSKFHVDGDIRSNTKFIGGGIRFGASSDDKISLFGDRFDLANNIGFGVELGNTLTYKTATGHNWYVNSNPDGGSGALMRLNGIALFLNKQLNSSVTGVPPFIVASNLLNVNLHADLLNKSVIAGTGLTGGGIMTADRTLSFDTVFGDARYLTTSGTGTIPYVSLSPDFGAGSANITGYDLNNSVKTSMFFVSSPVNGPTSGDAYFSTIGVGSSSAFQMSHLWGTQDAFYYRRKSGSVFYAWEQVASRSFVAATYMAKTWNLTAGVGLTGGGTGAANRTVSMGTPSTLTNATTNSATGTTHTHAITTANLVQGANIVLTGTLANRLIGSGDVTIAATSIPWSIVVSRPTTLDGYGITDGVKFTDFTTGLSGKENTFAKGNLIQSSGINLSGTLTNRLVGSGDVTVALQWSGVSAGTYRSVTVDLFGRVTGGTNPTTLSGYGLDSTVYTKTQVDALIAGAGGISGSGVITRIAVWGASNTLTGSAVMYDNGSQITVDGHLVVQGGSFVTTNYAGFPSSPLTGTIHYNATDDKLYMYTFGVGWAPFLFGA